MWEGKFYKVILYVTLMMTTGPIQVYKVILHVTRMMDTGHSTSLISMEARIPESILRYTKNFGW